MWFACSSPSNDFAELGAEVERRRELSVALQRFAYGKETAADIALARDSTHIYGEPTSGYVYLASIFNTRDLCKDSFNFAVKNGYPFLFLRQQLFWDGFPG